MSHQFESGSWQYGRVSEWLMVLVLKTNVAQVTVGSNPTPSEIKEML